MKIGWSSVGFQKFTLLGLIVGILIVLLLQVNYLSDDIIKTVRNSAADQIKEYRQELLEKYHRIPPAHKVLNTPKRKI